MNVENLKETYYIFGNKGNVWNNECHIAQSGSWTGRTLCDVPMLSSNWARIEEVNHIGCKQCNKIYNQQIKNND